ncbi:MAG: hypothetical protein HQM06_12920 [Magnetococcales bacterium]|nr:hypothetical protein [Magnetococcales bacterium]
MNSKQRGASLLELLIWIMVISVAVAGIIPLYLQTLSHLHSPMEGMQAHLLAQAVVEQLQAIDANSASDLSQLPSGECRQPDGVTPWVDPSLPLRCRIDLWVAQPPAGSNPFACTRQPWTENDIYLCATVTVQHHPTQHPIAQLTALYARKAPH